MILRQLENKITSRSEYISLLQLDTFFIASTEHLAIDNRENKTAANLQYYISLSCFIILIHSKKHFVFVLKLVLVKSFVLNF